ncbi:hypothetical protein [Nocardioides sp. InS609-2]|uniref:hypothetical protein n=1 Tax=Nocardioides sp. InS609-2 TaxID=2760705 RepID=UPI0020BD4BF1|nr:hypothetical protein [Nocardioides sp. InS609-2]
MSPDLIAGLSEKNTTPRDEATATMGKITALYGLRTAEAMLAWVDEAERELARLLPCGRQSATTS